MKSLYNINTSIRTYYFSITIIVGLLLISLSFYIYNDIEIQNNEISNEISRLSLQREFVDEVISTLTRLYQSVDSFLLDPTDKSSIDDIDNYLEKVVSASDGLYKNDHEREGDTYLDSIKLKDNLFLLSDHVTELIDLRTNVKKQIPGLALSAEIMAGLQNTLKTQLEILINEAEDGETINSPLVYPKLLKVQTQVEKLISQIRIYLANRLASYSTEILATQAESLRIIHLKTEASLIALLNLYRNEYDSFEGSDAIKTALDTEREWYRTFIEVRSLLESKNWRRDTYHKQTYFIPIFSTINTSLLDYKRHISGDEVAATELYKDNSSKIFLVLVNVIIFSLFYTLLLLFFVDLVVLKPIKNVAKAMKLRAFGHSYPQFEKVGFKEAKGLVDAFNEMDQQIQKRQSELEHQALHDALTSLPNRTTLDERLKYHMSAAKRNKGCLTLLLLDLNHFKQVNDSLGHHIGDLLLIKVSERLLQCIRESDTLVRLGGDEFGILMPDTKKEDAHFLTEKIVDMLSKTLIINKNSIHVTTSIGVVGYPEDTDDPSALMQLADIAMYESKKNKTTYTLYDSSMNKHITNRITILDDLHDAILNDQLELYYQPQIDLTNGKVIGCEALLRWNHEEHGDIFPEDIIHLAEQFGIMNWLTHSILYKAIGQCKKWHDKGYSINVSVNLSAQNLNDKKICETIVRILEKNELESRYLTLEITENSMMLNPGRAIDILKSLNAAGVMLSIDDFGTGFSSLSYLRDLPVQEVKIDKSFVIDMENEINDQMIVQSTIDLGHNLGLHVVAEGVETIAIRNKLKTMGCDFAQGYGISKSLNSEEISKWLENSSECIVSE